VLPLIYFNSFGFFDLVRLIIPQFFWRDKRTEQKSRIVNPPLRKQNNRVKGTDYESAPAEPGTFVCGLAEDK
jgi:hypothetical protein